MLTNFPQPQTLSTNMGISNNLQTCQQSGLVYSCIESLVNLLTDYLSTGPSPSDTSSRWMQNIRTPLSLTSFLSTTTVHTGSLRLSPSPYHLNYSLLYFQYLQVLQIVTVPTQTYHQFTILDSSTMIFNAI